MDTLHILNLEDNANDAELTEYVLAEGGITAKITVAPSQEAFCNALDERRFDVVLSDSSVPGFSALAALHRASSKYANIPFICLTGAEDQKAARSLLAAGAADYVVKDKIERLPSAVRAALTRAQSAPIAPSRSPAIVLASAVQALSLARDIETVRAIVRRAAREMTGADGATFVLRDGECCHYVDEDAISPLWKGQRFPLTACISGWAMLNQRPASIEDIYQDPRIPADAYRPTFVKSLVMVPIRTAAPIGAIGNYWATRHRASAEQVELLQALANSTAVAMENIQVYQELEKRVEQRTSQLEAANRELEAFSYSISHDLRAPLRAIRGYSTILSEQNAAQLDEFGKGMLERVIRETHHMGGLIEDLLRFSQINRRELLLAPVDLSEMADRILQTAAQAQPERHVDVAIAPELIAIADRGLIDSVLSNLLSNAWKYTGKTVGARIEFGRSPRADGSHAFFVKDNGAGFDMAHAQRLFAPFQRLHTSSEFPGTGVGLATVQRIIHRHGGHIWAEAEPGKGATFFFTLPQKEEAVGA